MPGRYHTVGLNVTEAEYEIVSRRAAVCGMSISAFLRARLRAVLPELEETLRRPPIAAVAAPPLQPRPPDLPVLPRGVVRARRSVAYRVAYDVTAEVLGDPPEGRSALDRKMAKQC